MALQQEAVVAEQQRQLLREQLAQQAQEARERAAAQAGLGSPIRDLPPLSGSSQMTQVGGMAAATGAAAGAAASGAAVGTLIQGLPLIPTAQTGFPLMPPKTVQQTQGAGPTHTPPLSDKTATYCNKAPRPNPPDKIVLPQVAPYTRTKRNGASHMFCLTELVDKVSIEKQKKRKKRKKKEKPT